MNNIKEVCRRLVKYLVLVLSVGFLLKMNNKLNNYEILIILVSTGLIYCILDIVSPSINLVIDH